MPLGAGHWLSAEGLAQAVPWPPGTGSGWQPFACHRTAIVGIPARELLPFVMLILAPLSWAGHTARAAAKRASDAQPHS